MKKITARYYKDGRIEEVVSFDAYLLKHSEQEIYDRIANKNKEYGREVFKVFSIPGELEDVLNFLIGEGGYKRAKTLETLCRELMDCNDDLSCIEEDIRMLKYSMEQTMNKIAKLQGEEPE